MKKIYTILIWIIAIFCAVYFLGPSFNIAIFDSQCKSGDCSGQICSADSIAYRSFSSCDWKPEYACNTDCRSRMFRCSFDKEFQKKCTDCIKLCKEENPDLEKIESLKSFEDCSEKCLK